MQALASFLVLPLGLCEAPYAQMEGRFVLFFLFFWFFFSYTQKGIKKMKPCEIKHATLVVAALEDPPEFYATHSAYVLQDEMP